MALIRRSKLKAVNEERDVAAVFDLLNAFSDPVTVVVVVAGTEVAVSHSLEYVPRMAIYVVAPGSSGTGVLYPGGTSWTKSKVYLTATVAGTYSVILRR